MLARTHDIVRDRKIVISKATALRCCLRSFALCYAHVIFSPSLDCEGGGVWGDNTLEEAQLTFIAAI
jgi:hypothetical protein